MEDTRKENRSPRCIADRAADRRGEVHFSLLCSSLTRIRLQLAIYFCLHRGKFAGKHRKLASFSSSIKLRPNYDRGLVLSTTGSISTCHRLGRDLFERQLFSRLSAAYFRVSLRQ